MRRKEEKDWGGDKEWENMIGGREIYGWRLKRIREKFEKGEELKWGKEEGRKNEFSLKLSAERGGIGYTKKEVGKKRKEKAFWCLEES